MKTFDLKAGMAGIAVLAAVVFISAGCGKETPVAHEDADLKQSKDLFDEGKGVTQEPVSADMVVAKVNGEEILFEDIQQDMQNMLASAPRVPPAEVLQKQLPQLLSQSLNNVITKILVKNAIETEGITVPDSEVEKRLRKIASSVPEGKKLSNVLAERGMEIKEFRAGLAEEMKLQKLVEIHTAGTEEPDDESAREYYEQNPDQFEMPATASAHHILIGFDEDDAAEDKAGKLEKITELRTQLVAGADFEELAKEHSTGPSAEEGGDLGPFPKGRMLENFDEAVFSQEIGEIGEPVETKFGYHLICVDDRKEAGKVTFEETKENIKSHLANMRKQQVLQDYMKELNEEADVEILRDLSKVNLKMSQISSGNQTGNK